MVRHPLPRTPKLASGAAILLALSSMAGSHGRCDAFASTRRPSMLRRPHHPPSRSSATASTPTTTASALFGKKKTPGPNYSNKKGGGGAVRRRHTAVHVHPRGPHEDIAGQEQGHTEEHPPVVLPGSEDRGRRPERVREGTCRLGNLSRRGIRSSSRKNLSKPPARPDHHCSRRYSRSWRGSRRNSTASHVRCRALP